MSPVPAFALANLAPALVLGLGCYALPLRWWGMDAPVLIVVVGLLASSGVALRSPRLAPRALRVAASALLALGLGLVAAFALCVAFLAGIHGPFGDFGMLLMGLVVLLIAPYALVYPAFQLWWLGRARTTASTGGKASAGGVPAGAGLSVPTESAASAGDAENADGGEGPDETERAGQTGSAS